ncbi:amidohydrolase family protein [Pseudorhizobium flavum]|uniref:Putative TIM-barrel fold metal-dependent hydrolase n=1 Tax=Pseudorhizobium flavum TaxID=1335061 RepID=A0A7W9YVR4_9HYPH|nr:amidohydrolase family protein [Pseudorhizobium flavum]MBB6179214.1 putative TIM-barrel fold metal-dependent hydrolase [Pseudorhizobium flavum]CAD6603822.1 2-pyrone-4,6-dicarboxylate hydrolase [Pseudorhizobium flavum]
MTSAPSPKDQQKRKPNFTAPALSCDAHCHVFGPAAVFPYAPDRRYTPEDAPKEALAALHERLGLERAVIVQASCHGTDNRAMLDAIAWRPDSYRGVAIVDDTFDDTALQALHDGGVRGVRFNFVKHLGGAPDMVVFDRVIDRIKGRGWHVVLHLDAVDIVPLSDMIRGLPIPFVIDHMGRVDTALGTQQPAFQSLLELARREDCWVKVCGSERISRHPFDAAIPFARALVEASPERTLWGTDFPHPNLKEPVDEADLLDLVARIGPTAEEQQRLLVDNPARLYGFTT